MWSDNETTNDLLGFQHLASAVTAIVGKDDLLPATIGVYGDWGSGKSSLIQIIQKELEGQDGTVVITFNGWLFEGYEDAKTALMGSILEELIDNKRFLPATIEKARKLLGRIDGFKLASGVGKIALGLATGGFPIAIGGGVDLLSVGRAVGQAAKEVKDEGSLAGAVKEKQGSETDDENLRRSIRKFRKDFGELLDESKIKRLVIIIDDLDRCLPDTIIETLEAIKLFLFVERTAFILGADERLVKYAVRKRFPELSGERVEVGRDYLEKLVQFPVRVPPLGRAEMETYIGLLFTQISELTTEDQGKARSEALRSPAGSLTDVGFNLAAAEKMFGDGLPMALKEQLSLAGRVAPLLSSSLKGNPRQCKRFLNTLLMRLQMAESREVKLQQRVLAKLMLLEYFRPESFRRLADLQAAEEGRPLQLRLMELDVAPYAQVPAKPQSAIAIKKKKGRPTNRKPEPTETSEHDRIEIDGEFKTWTTQNWIREWLMLEPGLAEIDLRPYFFFSRDSLISPLSGDMQRMSPVAEEAFVDLMKESQAVQESAFRKAVDLSVADAVAVFEGLSRRAQQEEEFGPDNRALQRLFGWTEKRPELRGELVTLLRRLPEKSVSASLVPKLIGLIQGHDSETSGYELLDKWSKGTNEPLAKIAKARLAKQRSS